MVCLKHQNLAHRIAGGIAAVFPSLFRGKLQSILYILLSEVDSPFVSQEKIWLIPPTL